MTAGSLIQIMSSSGEEDAYLTFNPQFSYFKTVYRRYTNFSTYLYKQSFINKPDFGKQCCCSLQRIGDLISNIFVYVQVGSLNNKFTEVKNINQNKMHKEKKKCLCAQCIDKKFKGTLEYGWVNALGHAILKSMWIEINGQRIDKHYGEWLEILSELTLSYDKRMGYFQMINKVDPTNFRVYSFPEGADLWIPLKFWFCSYETALPILCLPYQDVQLYIDFRDFDQCWVSNQINAKSPSQPDFNAYLWIEYIMLDLQERKKLVNRSHTILIEQLQIQESGILNSSTFNTMLFFDHPIKEYYWCFQSNATTKKPNGTFTSGYPIGNDWFNFSLFEDPTQAHTKDIFQFMSLYLNGIDRLQELPASYFRLIQQFNNHTNISNQYIYSYSFALYPENKQPSGSLNASRLQTIGFTFSDLQFKTEYKLRIYAVSYNILLITTGVATLLYL